MFLKKSTMHKSKRMFILFVGVYISVSAIVSIFLYQRIGAFGCGDECINYAAGYFLNNGKSLYREIFFNHQPGLAYVSALIQYVSHPNDLYHLVLYHRIAVAVYSLVFGLLLLFRFRLPAGLFLIFYEGTKYYVSGYQFIGEAFIVYPLVYLVSLVWETALKKRLHGLDLYATVLCTLIVIWLREPYIPLALVMCANILSANYRRKEFRGALFFFFFGIFAPFLVTSVGEYLHQVWYANIPLVSEQFGKTNSIASLVTAFLYPWLVFFTGKISFLRNVEIGIAVFFLTGIVAWVRSGKQRGIILLFVLVLALAAIRAVPPGSMFYDVFHMLPWYALFISVTVHFLLSVRPEKFRDVLVFLYCVFIVWVFISPRSFVWERIDRMAEFESQYAKYTHYSDAIRIITKSDHKIFLDMWDDIIYWESDRDSSYPFSLYIPIQSRIPKYQQMRYTMFREKPPDVYYSCPELQTPYNSLPAFVTPMYTQLYSLGSPSCLYVKNTIIFGLTEDQKNRLKALDVTI